MKRMKLKATKEIFMSFNQLGKLSIQVFDIIMPMLLATVIYFPQTGENIVCILFNFVQDTLVCLLIVYRY